MGSTELVKGLARIWSDDRLALDIALGFVVVQIGVLLLSYLRTLRFVSVAREANGHIADLISERGFTPEVIQGASRGETKRALRTIQDLVTRGDEVDREEVADLLTSSSLLPSAYNARWDAAAPGVFTAIGILGTFVGLILGFLRVDPGNASNSVGPLLGGMVVAFGNSFVGVLLSILWTVGSRRARHRFEQACRALLHAVTDQLPHTSHGQRSIEHLKGVDEGVSRLAQAIEQLAKNTQESSDRLLENLSKNVGASFESIVNKPFEQVNSSVARFNEMVETAARVHEALLARMDATARQLDEGAARLTTLFATTHECVEEFTTATLQMREASAAVEGVVSETHEAARQMRATADAAKGSVTRIAELVVPIEGASAAMTVTADALSTHAGSFERSTERFERASGELESAVTTLRGASDKIVKIGTEAVASQLGSAIAAMSESLEQTGRRTIAAYEESAGRVVEAVADNMTDLTERMSANLATLGGQIGEQADSMGHVMSDIKRQVEFATRTNRESLDQLAKTTPEVIKAQLSEFDRALARAVDHFSGTLEQWDGKLSAIEELAGELRRASRRDSVNAIAAVDENGGANRAGDATA